MRRIGLWFLICMPFVVVALVALSARAIESRVFWGSTSPADAYRAALTYVGSAPNMHGASFTPQQESVVERWGPTRWRVSGYADAQPSPGAKVHAYYSCVLHYAGQARWEVEDLHFERIQ